MIQHFFDSQHKITNVPKKPMNVIMCLEETCNLKCIQCDIWKNKRIKPLLSLEKRQTVILKLKKWLGDYTLNIFAGEPLIHPQIYGLIKFASDHGIKTLITTNATLVSPPIAEKLLKSGISGIYISLDAPTAKTHNYIRGREYTFDKATEGIKNLVSLRDKSYPNVRIAIESLIMNKNFSELIEMVSFAQKLGVDGIAFQPITSKYGFGRSDYDSKWHESEESLMPDPNEVTKVLNKLIKIKKQGNFILNPVDHLKKAIEYFNDPDSFSSNHECYAHNNFSVDITGNINLCFSQKSIGTIDETDYKKLWNSKSANEARNDNKKCDKTTKIILCTSTSLAQAIGLE